MMQEPQEPQSLKEFYMQQYERCTNKANCYMEEGKLILAEDFFARANAYSSLMERPE